jgi:uncharacterized protein (DUF1778 family)
MNRSRRRFLAEVGQGMLVASVGSTLALDLGLASKALAGDAPAGRLTFGSIEPLVDLMQETQADKLLPLVVAKLQNGTELRTIVAAAALANARAFGGHDYDGYHTFMALSPAYQMAQELPEKRRALPVLKVLHRNARFIENAKAHSHDAMHPVAAAAISESDLSGPALRDAMRHADQATAEQRLAALTKNSLDEAYNDLQFCVQDDVDVHRVVIAWRAWATLDLTGKEQALTLLRQSVRFCVDSEQQNIKNKREPGVRAALTKLLDQYKLLGRKTGDRKAEDSWIEKLCQTIYAGNRDQAADAVAAALAEGMATADIGEAISLAANRLVLRDPGRARADTGKPIGSIHGASVGVHASDSANAWRNIARVTDHRNTVASLIVAGYHTAGQAGQAGRAPLPWAENLEAVKGKDAKSLLGEVETAVKAKDQVQVTAIVQRYGDLGLAPRPLFDLLLKFAISEDGALHAEKYYRTVSEEFASTRPAFRWRHLVALARVTASEYGFPAPGYADACRLLNV